jgi:hypothetical protein
MQVERASELIARLKSLQVEMRASTSEQDSATLRALAAVVSMDLALIGVDPRTVVALP